MNWAREYWGRFNRRERIMVAAMVVAVALFVLAYGVVLPLHGAREAARERHARAATELLEVEAAARTLEAARRRHPDALIGDAFVAAVLDTAGVAGVSVSRRDIAPDGAVAIGIDAVGAPSLLAWLDALRNRHGIAPQQLRIDKRDGRLRVDAIFAPPPR